jgi:3-carboxy-cis,cis-muconate cycloisomerase
VSVSPFDSALYRDLFGDAELHRLFSDTAEVRAMMLVLGALAKAQGAAGVIPEVSGRFLHRAMMEAQVDPAGLAEATGRNGVTVPGLVETLRKSLDAPEHAQYLHWGATSQDIQDTALMLRMRQALALIESADGVRAVDAGGAGRGARGDGAGGADIRPGGDALELRGDGGELGRPAPAAPRPARAAPRALPLRLVLGRGRDGDDAGPGACRASGRGGAGAGARRPGRDLAREPRPDRRDRGVARRT